MTILLKDIKLYCRFRYLFESGLSFKINHKLIINKAYKMLGFINRNHLYLKNLISELLELNSLVKLNLEFVSLIWSNNYSTYLSDLNNIIICYRVRKVRGINLNICN